MPQAEAWRGSSAAGLSAAAAQTIKTAQNTAVFIDLNTAVFFLLRIICVLRSMHCTDQYRILLQFIQRTAVSRQEFFHEIPDLRQFQGHGIHGSLRCLHRRPELSVTGGCFLNALDQR